MSTLKEHNVSLNKIDLPRSYREMGRSSRSNNVLFFNLISFKRYIYITYQSIKT